MWFFFFKHKTAYKMRIRDWSSDVCSSDLAKDRDEIVLRDAAAGIYKRLVLQNGRIIGVVLYGDTADGAWFFDLLKKQADISEMRDTLIFGRGFVGGAPQDPMAAVASLSDDMEICGCNGVCKGKITAPST